MSDKGKPIIVTINGLDISKFVTAINDLGVPVFVDDLPGIQRMPDIQISGRWDDGTKDCIVCGGHFVPGPEGTAYVTVEQTGERFGPVCHACGTSLMSPTE